MAEYEIKVREKLKENGCYFKRRGKGDHDIWFSPITNRTIPVDSVIKSRYLANVIMKQAGIRYHF
ncbi:MAG: type II toxin-antitoxin system HicA family toxin [Treponema sp.]|nr:type II toxin-antitoxin system HicA family toxin [Treponema sp.]